MGPLSLDVPAADMHDNLSLEPLVRGIPALRSRRGPRRRSPVKLRADKGFARWNCRTGQA
ncbi:hypothetical protein [Streptomyces sp. NPDC017673]|uniref:hypothetical protein n=1 Tax=unclassified Streptomyces TaxID=2593676 RepID=UPI0037959789